MEDLQFSKTVSHQKLIIYAGTVAIRKKMTIKDFLCTKLKCTIPERRERKNKSKVIPIREC